MPVVRGLQFVSQSLVKQSFGWLGWLRGRCALPLCHQRSGREGEDLVHLDGPVGSGSCVCYFCSRREFSALFPATACLVPVGWDISIDQRNKSGLCKIFSVLHTSIFLGTHFFPALECRSPSKIVSIKVVVSLPGPFLLFSCSVDLTLCNPKDCSTPGFPILHQLLELAQMHVLWVGDAIQPPHPLSPTSPPALNLFQHQGVFQWVGSSHKVAKVVKFLLPYTNIFYTHIHIHIIIIN